ncbi:MAG TPA: hypothetical protein VGH32_02390, partial [Pirellulales bacterium]
PKDAVPRWLSLRGRALARSGRADDAAATADLLTRTEPGHGENLVAAAEIYAILTLGTKTPAAVAGNSLDGDPEAEPATVAPPKTNQPLAGESGRLRKSQDGYAALAVKLLRDAGDVGYAGDPKNPSAVLLANKNLAALLGRNDFQSLLHGLDLAAAEKNKKPK